MIPAGASPLNILVICNAAPLEIIAASKGNDFAEMSAQVNISHSVTLMDTIDRCMKKLCLTARDLDCIGVGVGPGSFTGIRIAVSTARMFAQVLGKPLVEIPTHLLFAASVPSEINDNILVAFAAKTGHLL